MNDDSSKITKIINGFNDYLKKINGIENLAHDKWCDTVGTLKYAKESILRWENNA